MSSVDDSQSNYVDTGVGIPDRLIRLWAPYRMNYIVNKGAHDDQSSQRDNPFIRIPALSDEDGLIVARGELVYCVLNLYPYNAGHMMVVPYEQKANLEDLTAAEMTELMQFAQMAVRVLKQVSQPDAINVGFNLGRSAGGSVGEHLHLHIVPRWNGDANFMTVIEGTKVLPQLLRDTRSLLAAGWRDLTQSDPSDIGANGA
ncbi:HIT domain-containing protein [Corynebacterium sp. ES2794-CONJ1]|uniref:HIT family protein n=1 Tax=unclassified Corynebacterium TaxID=2624378 RepID=UPI002168B10C|nr:MULTISPECIES: HIT domain-containing protein [unclassified Corynebacterium]MCS4489215.1 HIT domain-containing protein [Corynebacterium sp. ES2775-CONJ]MCS4491028.1 HIT domain-containing protein [Corynebacterium sp. ES2715-CONJ3]MCS4531091.1 HIT domain-containing protein [Corynebacterium sp. ES2730-CONJ]MCU9518458.1 HIT domain-containing protein [Corynebacterium sp. ES2794-CONJ1]